MPSRKTVKCSGSVLTKIRQKLFLRHQVAITETKKETEVLPRQTQQNPSWFLTPSAST